MAYMYYTLWDTIAHQSNKEHKIIICQTKLEIL